MTDGYPNEFLEAISQTGWIVSPSLFATIQKYLENKDN
tara:strand:- start:1638 stop:1751 length:114 start_codon:yes stop_codon:yes gene_type:complete